MSRLCIAGGGTGGHVFPALALADLARRQWPDVAVSFIGAERGLEARLLPERGEEALLLPMHGVAGAGVLRRARVLAWELPRAVARILRAWRHARPRLVVGVGGYASVAGVLAALLARIPVVLYEQNAVPGMVNRRLARLSRGVMLGFAEAAGRLPGALCVHVGNLVRPEIRAARWRPHEPPRLLVLGGSQGARFLNETAPAAGARLARKGRAFAVTHVAGRGNAEAVAAAWREAGVPARVLEFRDDMAGLYAEGDLLLARSGAMTVSEAAAVGMPAVFAPLPHAADHHQHANARVLADRGAAVMLDQDETDADQLAETLDALLFDPRRLERMSRASRGVLPDDGEARMLRMLGLWLGREAPAGEGAA